MGFFSGLAGLFGSTPAGAAVGAVGGLAGGAVDYFLGQRDYSNQTSDARWNMQMQHRSSMEQIAAQNAGQMNLMKYQNEYNDPSAQMSRYRNAGLNPALAIQQPNLSAGGQAGSGAGGASAQLAHYGHQNRFARALDLMALAQGMANVEATQSATQLSEWQKNNEVLDAVLKSLGITQYEESGSADLNGGVKTQLAGVLRQFVNGLGGYKGVRDFLMRFATKDDSWGRNEDDLPPEIHISKEELQHRKFFNLMNQLRHGKQGYKPY